MKCVICKSGDTAKSFSTITFEKNGSIIIFKKVPCLTCDQCGEVYIEEDISEKLYAQTEKTASLVSEVSIQTFNAA